MAYQIPKNSPRAWEIVKGINAARTVDERVELLKQNPHFGLKCLLQINFSPERIQFALPGAEPPTWKKHDVPSIDLSKAVMIFSHLKKDSKSLNQFKKEAKYVQLLESVGKDDAELIIQAIGHEMHKRNRGITEVVVERAFPGLILKPKK